MGVAAILVMWRKYFAWILATYYKESSLEIWAQLGQWFVRKYI